MHFNYPLKLPRHVLIFPFKCITIKPKPQPRNRGWALAVTMAAAPAGGEQGLQEKKKNRNRKGVSHIYPVGNAFSGSCSPTLFIPIQFLFLKIEPHRFFQFGHGVLY